MYLLPLFVNAVVIGAVAAELIAISFGKASADELLIISTISGLLTIFSYRLSREALEHHLESEHHTLNDQSAEELEASLKD